ncbi:flagellar hook-length control protein FliK [Mariprofundus ferrooxydans]|uniref:flagellar hook-length control protein FliK n=1 Tax=Mariprofundus ferrooxydans TaxID=314344 RepID=UPI001364A7E9|nr:flagellar hook-length control protein FliK [Mariprofundus ferrooxydans]
MTGPGSSGIAEKSASTGKQAASGLFAKLMAILGKQGKGSEGNASPADNQQPKFTIVQHITLGQQKSIQKELLTGPATATKLATPQINNSEDGSTVQAVALQILSQPHATTPKSTAFQFNPDETTEGKRQTIHFGSNSGKQNKTVPVTSTKDTSVQAAHGHKQGNTQTTDTKEVRLQTTDGKQINTPVADDKSTAPLQAEVHKAAPVQTVDSKQINTPVADAKAAPLQAEVHKAAPVQTVDSKQINTPVADAKTTAPLQAEVHKAAPVQTVDGKQINTPVADAKAAPLQAEVHKAAPVQTVDGKQINTPVADAKAVPLQAPDNKQVNTPIADAKAAPLQAEVHKAAPVQTVDSKQINTPVADAKAAPLQAPDNKQVNTPIAGAKTTAPLQAEVHKAAPVQTVDSKQINTPVADAKTTAPLQAEVHKAAPVQTVDGKQINTPVADAKAAPLQAPDNKQINTPVAGAKAAALQAGPHKAGPVQATAGGKQFSTPVAQAKETSIQIATKGDDAEQPKFNSQTKLAAAATAFTAGKQSQPAKQAPSTQAGSSAEDKVMTARSSATVSTAAAMQNSPQTSEQAPESTVFSRAIPSVKGEKQAAGLAKNEKVKHASEAKQNAGTERVSPVALHNVTTQQPSQPPAAAGTSTAEALTQGLAQGDSGQQSGDKGNQEPHSFQVTSADNRPASASVSASHFQQYLNHRPTPTMTMFDSIQHIAQSAKNGQTKLEIQLDPVNLGKIHISLQTDASKQIQIHMIVDQSGTRTAMDQQLPAIRHALAEQGLNLSGFSMGSHGGQASSGFGDRQSSGGSQPDKNSTDNVKTSPIAANRHSAFHSDSGLSIHI